MEIIADLEVHSKYARAVSSSMAIPTIVEWAAKKGIGLVGTGDFTHPMWFREIEANLEEAGEGVYKLKNFQFPISNFQFEPKFLLTSEVSCIYKDKDKGRRVHLMVYLPTLNDVRKFNSELTKMGANLFSDGRPIIGLSLYQVAYTAFAVNSKALVIPAHVWTPWFGFYGSESGYDYLEDAFKDLTDKIYAVETGLSSDPAMNWKIAELDDKRIVSFGDAHSPQKLGREATVLEIDDRGKRLELSYDLIWRAISQSSEVSHLSLAEDKRLMTDSRIAYTIEFYPEEGKYHYTGHRQCGVVYSPHEVKRQGLICPVCSKRLTLGVASRVETLAKNEIEIKSVTDERGVRYIHDEKSMRTPYVMLVPLIEIIAEVYKVGVATKGVLDTYERMLEKFGSEFNVLLKADLEEVSSSFGKNIADSLKKVRIGDIFIKPGYDGIFGTVKIWKTEDEVPFEAISGQKTLF